MIKLSVNKTKLDWFVLHDPRRFWFEYLISGLKSYREFQSSNPWLRVIQTLYDLLVAFPLYIDIKERQMITFRYRKFLPRCVTFLFSSFWAEKYGWNWQHGYYSLQNEIKNISWDDEVVKT